MLKNLIATIFMFFCMVYSEAADQKDKPKGSKESAPQEVNLIDSREKIILDENDLQSVLDKFTDDDKKVIKDIQTQILNWSDDTFAEIRAYREFVIDAHKKAQTKYAKLSTEAKEAMKIEIDLKAKLSPAAQKVLSGVELRK